METCPNCSTELIEKKVLKYKRLKCTECGYETSKSEIGKECENFLERVKEDNVTHNTLNQFNDE